MSVPGGAFRVCCALLLFLCWSMLAQSAQLPVLNWTERSDWINVKTDVTPHAVGDGVTDDTAAIQTALNTTGKGIIVYFPPGTYKVTSTLTLNRGSNAFAMTLIGHGRTSVLRWAGTATNLITINGNPYTRYVGLTLDGQGIATNGFNHFNTTQFETEIRFQHMGFYNFTGCGIIAATDDTVAMAETSYENCIFDHCGTGISLGSYNDYDHTVTGCDFLDCGTGIYCNKGNYYVRDCFFQRSTIRDIHSQPEHGSSVRRCKSVGSAQFIMHSSGVTPLYVEDCFVDGWTGANGAIQYSYRPPLTIANCRFVNPPDTDAPVRVSFWDDWRAVIACNNVAPQSNAVIALSPATLYTVPKGAEPACVGSPAGATITSFVNPTVTVPPVVYDAKVNFGATGNGTTDDTTALQNCINAARNAGNGAIAYIPLGTYKITATLNITGSNYVVGGSGFFSRLKWAGAAGGTMMSVVDPNNITLEHLVVGSHDIGTMNNSIDIEQTSTGAASRMNYDGVAVWGKYQNDPEHKGLRLNGLGANCTVVIQFLQGNLRLLNSANATILGNITYEGGITVDHASATRNGFLGFMTRLATLIPDHYDMTIRNSNSVVMSDWYIEQGYNGILLSGANGDPAGRVTINNPKIGFTNNLNALLFNISNYHGRLLYGPTQFYVQSNPYVFTQSGTNPMNTTIFGGLFYNSSLTYTGDSSATFNFVGNGNAGTGVAPADNYTAQTLTDMALAVDDYQRLGAIDLALNFPYIDLSAPTPPTATPQSVTTAEDVAKAITLTGSDANNAPLTFAVATAPAHGTLTGTAPALTYTPGPNYHGSDSFTFTVNNGQQDSTPATVSITVQATKLESDAAPRPLGSATLTTSDWVQVGRFAVMLDTPAAGSEFQRADCAPRATFGDGTVTVADWVQAGRYIVGIDAPVLASGPSTPPAGMAARSIVTSDAQALASKAPRVVSLAHATLVRGRTGTVTLVLRGQGSECALGGTLRFDPARLQFIGATATDRTTTLLLNTTRAAQGQVALSLMRPLPRTFPTGETTVVTLLFRVPSTAPRGIAPITYGNTLATCTVVNVQAEPLPATFTAGVVTIH